MTVSIEKLAAIHDYAKKPTVPQDERRDRRHRYPAQSEPSGGIKQTPLPMRQIGRDVSDKKTGTFMVKSKPPPLVKD
jgi:hypothetical protein